jgi:hypothetical protein
MQNEIWKPIDGYDQPYKVSNRGRVLGKYGILRPYDNGYGYLVVDFRKDGKRKHLKVHRLVAEAFIRNENNLPEVNHKDENKHNNDASNLEWCDSSYNKKYGNGRKTRSDGMKKVWEARRAEDGN